MDIILFYILLYFLSYRLWIILSGKSISLSTNIEIKINSFPLFIIYIYDSKDCKLLYI